MRPLVSFVLLLAMASSPAGAASMLYEQHAGRRVSLGLPPEMGASWRAVNVGRVQIRSTRKQQAVPVSSLPEAGSLELALDGPGCSLIQVDIGPPSLRGEAGAWRRVTRCTKIVACTSTSRAMRRRSNALVTGKTGSRIEIRPLLNPAVLIPGSDLPVRLYWEGAPVESRAVRASGPDGRLLEAVSDAVGIAFLRISDRGRWTIEFSHGDAHAELIFDVP